MTSFFNREDSLDREFDYIKQQRNKIEILQTENKELKEKQNELETENKKLKEKLKNCSHFKSQLKWYENFFEEALMKYFHDYDFIIKNKDIKKPIFFDDDSEESLINDDDIEESLIDKKKVKNKK